MKTDTAIRYVARYNRITPEQPGMPEWRAFYYAPAFDNMGAVEEIDGVLCRYYGRNDWRTEADAKRSCDEWCTR